MGCAVLALCPGGRSAPFLLTLKLGWRPPRRVLLLSPVYFLLEGLLRLLFFYPESPDDMAQLRAEEDGLPQLCAGGLLPKVSPLLAKFLLPPTVPQVGFTIGYFCRSVSAKLFSG